MGYFVVIKFVYIILNIKICSYIWIINLTTILKILAFSGILSHLLPLVFFLIFKRKYKEKKLWVIFFYILYCFLNDVFFILFQFIHSSLGEYVLPAFTIIEFSFLSYFFFLLFAQKTLRSAVKITWIVFTVFAFIDYFIINKMQTVDSFTVGIESLIIIIFSIYYLYNNLKDSINFSIYSSFDFWIVITLLIYFSGTFFIYLLAESNKFNLEFRKVYLILNSSFNIIKNVLLATAMCMKMKPTTPYSPKPNIDLDDDFIVNRTP